MTLEAFLSEYTGWLMLCFASGYGVGFLITYLRRNLEKI